MWIKIFHFFKKESGQAIILFALVFVVLCGFSALAIDVGSVELEKANLQDAADAAALAGAQDLPDAGTAESTAIYYAEQNGAGTTETTVTTPYNGDATKIEVVCTQTVSYTFAKVLGLNDTEVTVRAVAQSSKWNGDALPFINLDGDAENSVVGQSLTAWNKVDPGDKERINNNDLIISTNSIKLEYEDGFITYKKGKDMSGIKGPLNNILVVGDTVYVISLKESEMANYAKKGSKELKNGDEIPLSDCVLLECKVTAWNGKLVTLEFVNSYYISASGIIGATDGSTVAQVAKLVD